MDPAHLNFVLGTEMMTYLWIHDISGSRHVVSQGAALNGWGLEFSRDASFTCL